MSIHEPATLITDYLLALLGGTLSWRLHRHPSMKMPAVQWWFRGLLLLAASAFVGGSYHGFAPNFSPLIDVLWWRIVLWIICLLGFAMGSALICEIVPIAKQAFWKRLITAKLAISSLVVVFFPHFLVAIADYGLAMLSWGAVAILARKPWSGWMMFAVALSATAAWIQQNGSGWSGFLNHNDIFHLIQGFALIGFFRAAKLMEGTTTNPTRETINLSDCEPT